MFKFLFLLIFLSACETTNTIQTNPEKVITLECPDTMVIKPETYVFNKADRHNLELAKKGCRRMFNDSPCLKVFKVIGNYDYRATCGEPVEVIK